MKILHIFKFITVVIALFISLNIQANDFDLGVNDTIYCIGDCFQLTIDSAFIDSLENEAEPHYAWSFNDASQLQHSEETSILVCPNRSTFVVEITIHDEEGGTIDPPLQSTIVFTLITPPLNLTDKKFIGCLDSCVEIRGPIGANLYEWTSPYVEDINDDTVLFCGIEEGSFDVIVQSYVGPDNQCSQTDTLSVTVIDSCEIDTITPTSLSDNTIHSPLIYQVGGRLVIENQQINHHVSQIDIYNRMGQLVLSQNLRDQKYLKINSLSSDIYILKYTILGIRTSHKVLIN